MSYLFSISLSVVVLVNVSVGQDSQSGKRWAVLIGVDDYAKANDLSYCAADAQALSTQLVALGFDARQVRLLSDGAKESKYLPFKSNILSQLELVLKLAEPGDMVLVSFSGHGVQIGDEAFFCPTDADLLSPDSLISLNWLYEKLRRCRAALKFVIVDACRNDPRQAGFKGIEDTSDFSPTATPPEGVLSISSCSPGELSLEDRELGHGVFFSFLLAGLQGDADKGKDGNRNGRISLQELVNYAGRETKLHAASKFSHPQRPFLKGDLTIETLDYSLGDVPASRAGSLDQSFGNGGRTIINYNLGGNEDAYDLAVQTDGKIIVVGEAEKGFQKNVCSLAISRLNADGSPDLTFGQYGKSLISFGPYDDGSRGRTLLLQPDGKIVCGARAEATGWGYEFGLVRLLHNGALDPTFGTNGVVHTDVSKRRPNQVLSAEPASLTLQSDARIIAAGYVKLDRGEKTMHAVAMVRYLSNGQLDLSFGSGGIVTTDLPGENEEVYDVTVLRNGKIVVIGGNVEGPDGPDAFAIRYTSGGQLDTQFSGDGILTFNFGAGGTSAFELVERGDQLLLLASAAALSGTAIICLDVNGDFDRQFGGTRKGIGPVGTPSVGLTVLPDGRIVTARQDSYSFIEFSADGIQRESSSAGKSEARLELARCMRRATDGAVFFTGPTKNDGSGRGKTTVVKTHGPR